MHPDRGRPFVAERRPYRFDAPRPFRPRTVDRDWSGKTTDEQTLRVVFWASSWSLRSDKASDGSDRAEIGRDEFLIPDVNFELGLEIADELEEPERIKKTPVQEWVVVGEVSKTTAWVEFVDDESPDCLFDQLRPPS